MYHWRILPSHPGDININYWGHRKYRQYQNSDVIRKRVLDPIIMHQRISLYFLNMPHRILYDWLSVQIAQGDDSAEATVAFVDEQLKETNKYMNARGF